jgi:hypothetical protein
LQELIGLETSAVINGVLARMWEQRLTNRAMQKDAQLPMPSKWITGVAFTGSALRIRTRFTGRIEDAAMG